MEKVAMVSFTGYTESVAKAFDAIGAGPVLKAHSFATVTLSLKNMMGFAPPSHYQVGGFWKIFFSTTVCMNL